MKPITIPLLPDMGVIAQRYTLDLMGASQQLQIRSLAAAGRNAVLEDVPFKWKPDIWYTMKFQAAVEGRQGRAAGQGLAAREKEPEEWTIEAVDEAPNAERQPRPVRQRQRRRDLHRQHHRDAERNAAGTASK